MHPDAVLSHGSAAVLHRVAVPSEALTRVNVTRAGGVHGRSTRNVRVHVAPLGEHDVSRIGDLTCTSLARTVEDLARTLTFGWGVVAADAALRRDLPREALMAVGDARRRRGTTRLDAVALFADGRSGSPLESWSRVLLAAAGLPEPVLQQVVQDEDGWYAITDFAWPDFDLVGEADGKVKYDALLRAGESAADAVMAEKAREQRIGEHGWRVVRWSWADCHDGSMVRRVRRALVEGGWDPVASPRRP